MTTIVENAMNVCTAIFTTVLNTPELAVLALGFPVVRAGSGALKRIIKV